MKSYISIHDVSPEKLNQVKNIIPYLRQYSCKKITLLIIPGLKWSEEQLKDLRRMQKDNLEIAAHGWIHINNSPKNLYHYIHSKLFSRDCAEHLSKNKLEIIHLIQSSYKWFADNKFTPPTLYVPPAWALGKIKYSDLDKLPFNEYETMTGVYSQNKLKHIALIGFEADTLLRKYILKISNLINYKIAQLTGILRIAIHPDDLDLLLSNDINKFLSKIDKTIYLRELEK